MATTTMGLLSQSPVPARECVHVTEYKKELLASLALSLLHTMIAASAEHREHKTLAITSLHAPWRCSAPGDPHVTPLIQVVP